MSMTNTTPRDKDKPKKPEALVIRPRHQDPEYPRNDRGQPIKLQFGDLATQGDQGPCKLFQLRTAHSARDVLVPGYFDGSGHDFRTGDWLIASCSMDEEVTEPLLLYCEATRGSIRRGRDLTNPIQVDMTPLGGRPLPDGKS